MGRRVLQVAIVAVLLLAGFAGGWVAGRMGLGAAIDPASLDQREREFVERMRNVTLVGAYDIAGSDQPARPDRYEIASVDKVGDDLWRFNANMTCCGVNGHIPVVVPLRWIGDTPMIMMTDTTLPGLGTFTVRLFFYGDRYAGTWQHGERGGAMSGRVERK